MFLKPAHFQKPPFCIRCVRARALQRVRTNDVKSVYGNDAQYNFEKPASPRSSSDRLPMYLLHNLHPMLCQLVSKRRRGKI